MFAGLRGLLRRRWGIDYFSLVSVSQTSKEIAVSLVMAEVGIVHKEDLGIDNSTRIDPTLITYWRNIDVAELISTPVVTRFFLPTRECSEPSRLLKRHRASFVKHLFISFSYLRKRTS